MRVCLNMIVKNESAIISRAIDSVIDVIDSWCIIDTGSIDDTIEIIKTKLSHLPGEVISRPWVNFGHNRTEAFNEARKWAEWILLIDADMTLIVNNFDTSQLDTKITGYQIMQKNNSLSYYNTRILNSKFNWECIGVTHEYFSVKGATSNINKLESLTINDIGDGGSKSDKFERDIALLTQGLIDEPTNGRYMFYLAQSYKDTQRFTEAIEWYEKRILISGWYEEVWYSHYMIALCYIKLEMFEKAEEWVLTGYSYHPHRSEAIYEMCKAYRIIGNTKKAYDFYLLGKNIPYPKNDVLFISHKVYENLFDYEMTILHYYLFPNERLDGLRKVFSYLSTRFDQSVYSNSKFYVTPLSKYSSKIIELSAPTREGFTNTSPCYLKTRDGREIINIRQVNYTIDKSKGSYHYIIDGREMTYANTINDPIVTTNYLLDSGEMVESYKIDTHLESNIIGLEDIRLFEHSGEIRFFATTKHLNPEHKNRIATGKYDPDNLKISVDQVFQSPFNSNCEKNWISLNQDTLIYSWYPIITYSYPTLNQLNSINTPLIFNCFRGSTNPVKYKGLNWLVVHSVIYESPRTYLHYLVALDDDARPVFYSLPFSFEGEKIEYCLGLDIDEDHASFYYSTWDETSKKLTIPLSTFKESLILV